MTRSSLISGTIALVAIVVLVLSASSFSQLRKTQKDTSTLRNQSISFTNPTQFSFNVSNVKFTEHTGVTLTKQHSSADIVLLDPILIPSGTSLTTFEEQAAKLNDSTIRYQLSEGEFWSYFDGSAWVAARDCATCTNSADEINTHIASFPITSGRLQVKTFLTSGSQNLPILNSINIGTTGGELSQSTQTTLPSNLSQAFANDKIKICHATHSESNPYVFEEVDQHSTDGDEENEDDNNNDNDNNHNNNDDEHGRDHSHHEDDIIPATDRNEDGHIDEDDCNAPEPTATVVATKIVCDTESQLPNWGGGGPNITSATATTFVSSHSEHCHLESNWNFQWAAADATNPGDNLGEVGGLWNSFGPTNSAGVTQATVPLTDIGDKILIREELKSGYIDFGYSNGNSNNSAEMYCSTDVINYDNFDRILSPSANNTYYCLGLNVITPTTWDHSEIAVTAVCTTPSSIFTITNSGSDMDGTSQYRIYRNNVLETTQTFQLTAGQNIAVTVAGNGDTIRLEADQRPGHPESGQPQATLTDCGTPLSVATIVATKIVCDVESDLPNFGISGGPNITNTTASAFISSHPHCRLEPNWNFQWAPATATDPGDNLNEASSPWTTFGPTNNAGIAQTTVDLANIGDRIWMREALQAGYIGFGYSNNNNNISAEMYCSTDVLNYDNYEFILNPQTAHTYNCVAWNVPTPDTSDHSDVVVAGVCQAPYAVFTITNDGLGDMTAASQYRVYRNNVLETTLPFQLNAGQSQIINVAANGDSILVEADQLPNHTGTPHALIEHCGTPNQLPIANDDTTTTQQNTPISINVPVNDSDLDGTLMLDTVTVTNAPTNGTINSIDGITGIITYTPNPGFFGTDTFVYQICDDGGLCDTATVTVLVKAPPVAVDDTVTTPFQTPITINVLANDSDADGTLVPNTVIVTSGPSHGAISNINLATGEISYTPNIGFSGNDFFDYQICDNDTQCATATVAISVNSRLLHPPVALDDSATTPRDTAIAVNVLSNDNDSDGGLVSSSVAVMVPPAHGSITLINSTSGAITYQPTAGFSGIDQFTYQVCDTDSLCDTATVVIHVIAPALIPPVSNDDSAITSQNNPISIPVLSNDYDIDGVLVPATVAVVSIPLNGTTNINGVTGAITYTPTTGFNGMDSFTYQVCDNDDLCDTANVIIGVSSLLPPVANHDIATTSPNTSVTIDTLNNDSDADGSLVPDTTTVSSSPTHGAVSINPANGQATYTPNVGFSGTDIFTYTVCDNDGLCNSANVSIDITAPTPIPPIANDDATTANRDTPITINVLSNDSDTDGVLVANTTSIITPPVNGTITNINITTGQITYSPNEGYSGLDSFIYQICDNNGLCDTATVIIGIADAKVPPIANNDTATTLTNTPTTITVLDNDLDIDGTLATSSLTIVSIPTHGTTTINSGTGVIIYSPTANFSGIDNFTYQICDNDGLCDTAIVDIIVNQPGIPPTAFLSAALTTPPLVVPTTLPLTELTQLSPATVIPSGSLMFGANQFILAAQSQPLSSHGVLQITTNQPQTFYLEAKGATSTNLVNLDTKVIYPLVYSQDLKLWTATFAFPKAGTYHLQGQISNESQTYAREINQVVVTDPSTITLNNTPANATVTVFEQDLATGNFRAWNGSAYAQENPFSVLNGNFSLVLPSGQFYLRVTGTGFAPVTSRIVSINQQSLVTANVALSSSKSAIAQFFTRFIKTSQSNNFDITVTQLPEPQQLPLNQAVPGIIAHSETGTVVDLVATQQKPTVIMAYGNWNTLAQEQLAIFSAVEATTGPDISFIPLSTMDPDADDIAYLKRGNYNLKFYKPTDAFFDQYFISSLPQFFILNTQHQLVASIIGPQSADSLSSAIERALQNQ